MKSGLLFRLGGHLAERTDKSVRIVFMPHCVQAPARFPHYLSIGLYDLLAMSENTTTSSNSSLSKPELVALICFVSSIATLVYEISWIRKAMSLWVEQPAVKGTAVFFGI